MIWVIQLISPKKPVGIARMLDMPFIETSRVWVCTECGAKVFFCKTVFRPQYQCLCGAQTWKQSARGIK
ncbi:hypothetical protein SOV_07640 [Sporomusa ovata DSM 2662]|nr:hypothetical protein SOV_1c01020 [Sporomusa ovata DSM 2662]